MLVFAVSYHSTQGLRMKSAGKDKFSRRNRRNIDQDATPLDIVHEPQHTIQPFSPRTKPQNPMIT